MTNDNNNFLTKEEALDILTSPTLSSDLPNENNNDKGFQYAIMMNGKNHINCEEEGTMLPITQFCITTAGLVEAIRALHKCGVRRWGGVNLEPFLKGYKEPK